LMLSHDQTTFQSKFAQYVYEAMLAVTDKRSACCGKYADGFVTSITVAPPPVDTAESLLQVIIKIEVDLAFPACQDTECHRRLRVFAIKLNNEEGCEEIIVSCANCLKAEDRNGPKFKICSRCKMRYYCRRKFQKADWQDHKKMCKA
jgi:hypothetical protein